jgi:hypothetical protein
MKSILPTLVGKELQSIMVGIHLLHLYFDDYSFAIGSSVSVDLGSTWYELENKPQHYWADEKWALQVLNLIGRPISKIFINCENLHIEFSGGDTLMIDIRPGQGENVVVSGPEFNQFEIF